jgi:hypothetical protein
MFAKKLAFKFTTKREVIFTYIDVLFQPARKKSTIFAGLMGKGPLVACRNFCSGIENAF